MDMYTVWCGPCKMLDKNTFHNKDVADYINKYYYAVKFNAEGRMTKFFLKTGCFLILAINLKWPEEEIALMN